MKSIISVILFAFCYTVFSVCGERIVGGVPAEPGEFPSQLALHFNDSLLGAANVLSEKYVLTCGHCVFGFTPAELSVRSGSLYYDQGQRHQVTRIIQHEDFWFNQTALLNDIAIVEVDPPFTFGPYVQPISLPNQGEDPPVGAPATIIGWGRIYFEGPVSEIVNKVDIQIQDQTLCEEAYAQLNIPVVPSQICASDPNSPATTCNGDSGGPLLVDGVTVGITSWGNFCKTEGGFPAVYTRVSIFRDWIRQHTGI